MSPRTKREYLEAVHRRYKNATRVQKSLILDEYCATTGHHRKHAIRQLGGFKRFTAPKPKKRGRKPLYDYEAIRKPLKKIWLTANLPCSKRLKPIVPLWLPGYEAFRGPEPEDPGGPAADLGSHHRPHPPTHPQADGASRTNHHQARRPAAQPDPPGNQPVGSRPTRLPGGRHGRSLRRLHGRPVR